MTTRLTRLATHGVPGLADLEIDLQPVTALIGPRGSGKSRLLAAISWLLTGSPALATALPDMLVSGDIDSGAGPRRIARGPADDGSTLPVLPRAMLLPARDRLTPLPGLIPPAVSDSSRAEALADMIADPAQFADGQVLLIEEPELMLTPQQQRDLYEVLRGYAERGQVIYSTRSAALLDAAHHHEIVRLDLTSAGLAVRRAPPETLTDEERLRLAAEFDHERAEMFFATAVVLVEGQTERQAMPVIFRALGHDPDALGISIVEVGGKGNLVLGARLLAEMRIPHVIVHDSDRGRPGWAENAGIRASAQGAPVFVLDPDFEAAAGIHAHDDKVLKAWHYFSQPHPRVPTVFRSIVEKTVELASRARSA